MSTVAVADVTWRCRRVMLRLPQRKMLPCKVQPVRKTVPTWPSAKRRCILKRTSCLQLKRPHRSVTTILSTPYLVRHQW